MKTLSARPAAEALSKKVASGVEEFKALHHRVPKLAVVLVGDDPPSVIYTQRKGRKAIELGMEHETHSFSEHVTPEVVFQCVENLNQDPSVDGILIQRPLPSSFKEQEVIHWIQPQKDVDAFHPANIGLLSLGMPCLRPCTPAGILELLDYYDIELEGQLACVIGRSSIVGSPMGRMLLQRNATLLQTHSRTRDLSHVTRQADLLVVAAGKPQWIDPSFVKEGAVVVDVGIHRTPDDKVVGDVQFSSLKGHASAVTPVPGGVGPMTIAQLMQNTLDAARSRV